MVFLFMVISVSVDAYAAGLAFNLGKNLTFFDTVYASFYTFIACLAAVLTRDSLDGRISALNVISGILLVLIGLGCIRSDGIKILSRNSVEKRCSPAFVKEFEKRRYVTALGITVSVDAAAASLATPEVGAFECAFLMFVFHAFFLRLGALTAKPLKALKGVTLFSGIFLISLGIYRIVA